MKVYKKRGNISLKEKAMVKEIEKYVESELAKDPNFVFKPAENEEELKAYFDEFSTSDAEIIDEVKLNKVNEKTIETEKADTSGKLIDPFNREEPIIRDYVLEETFAENTTNSDKKDFAEPISFDESFEIPEATEVNENSKKIKPRSSKEEISNEALNPEFNQMDSAKQRRQTKRFAKQIVEITTTLIKEGFIWYTSRNITESKIIEYEAEGLDLELLLDMPDGQRTTIRHFFVETLANIQQEAEIDQEEKEDLTDALTEVFLEKGIAPTPTQNLILVSISILGKKALTGFAIDKSVNAVVNQLRAMKSGENEEESYVETPKEGVTPKPNYTEDNTMFDNYNETNSTQSVTLAEGIEIMFPVEKTTE